MRMGAEWVLTYLVFLWWGGVSHNQLSTDLVKRRLGYKTYTPQSPASGTFAPTSSCKWSSMWRNWSSSSIVVPKTCKNCNSYQNLNLPQKLQYFNRQKATAVALTSQYHEQYGAISFIYPRTATGFRHLELINTWPWALPHPDEIWLKLNRIWDL